MKLTFLSTAFPLFCSSSLLSFFVKLVMEVSIPSNLSIRVTPRRVLQSLAKSHGIKANMKSSDIILQLEKIEVMDKGKDKIGHIEVMM
jgi:hypothetical protein